MPFSITIPVPTALIAIAAVLAVILIAKFIIGWIVG